MAERVKMGRDNDLGRLLRQRGIAFLLDYIVTMVILALILVLATYIKRHWPLFRTEEVLLTPGFLALGMQMLYRSSLASLDGGMVTGLISALGLLVTGGWIFYNWVYVYAHDRQSLGKYLIGLRVRRVDGVPMSYGVAIRRHLLGYPLSILLLGLGILPIVRDPRRQGWHDRLAGTLVESK
jgi:uncharacterized RDD family membrane protein YckC